MSEKSPGVPRVLFCPKCGGQHVDRIEIVSPGPVVTDWATRPHRTHLCEHCKHLWRPEEFNTVGVVIPPGHPLAAQGEKP